MEIKVGRKRKMSNFKSIIQNYVVDKNNKNNIGLNISVGKNLGWDTSFFLSELISYQFLLENDQRILLGESFFIGRKFIKKRTGLSPYKQKIATRKLINVGILSVKRIGFPPKNKYSINFDYLEKFLLKIKEP